MQPEDPTERQLQELAVYLNQQRPQILARWRRATQADPEVTTSASMSRSQLFDRIPEILKSFEKRIVAIHREEQKKAIDEQHENGAGHGLHRWHNEYNVRVLGRPGAVHVDDPWDLLDQVSESGAEGGGAAVVGTPDDLVQAIEKLQTVTGGFGVVLGFAHDWANRENTLRSWDLVARYVIPALNGSIRPMQASADYVEANKAELIGGASAAGCVDTEILVSDQRSPSGRQSPRVTSIVEPGGTRAPKTTVSPRTSRSAEP